MKSVFTQNMYIPWSYWPISFCACSFARHEGFTISSFISRKNSLKMKLFFSLPRDSKQASFCDSFCITVSFIACNFTENKPRDGRWRTYTVKIFNEIIRYCYFFFQVITYRKTRNLSVKICHAPLLICMEYIWTHDIFRLTLKLRFVSCWFELCILKI